VYPGYFETLANFDIPFPLFFKSRTQQNFLKKKNTTKLYSIKKIVLNKKLGNWQNFRFEKLS